MSETRPDEYPDGSVGHYVRQRWAAQQREEQERAGGNSGEDSVDGGSAHGSGEQGPGMGARRDEAWGVVPDDAGWGSDLLELDGDLAGELDEQNANGWPSEPTPPHGHRYADQPPAPPAPSHGTDQHAHDQHAAREQALQEQAARERAAQEQAAREQAAREQAAREQQAQEHAARERALQEQAAREQAAREHALQEQAARERAAQEQAARERAAWEQAAREREAQENEARAQAAREHAAREQAVREQAAREREAQEQAAREQAAREHAAREQAAREQAAGQHAAQEQSALEQAAQEQGAREQAAQDQQARELAARDETARLAAHHSAQEHAARERAAQEQAAQQAAQEQAAQRAAQEQAAQQAAREQAEQDYLAQRRADQQRLGPAPEPAAREHTGPQPTVDPARTGPQPAVDPDRTGPQPAVPDGAEAPHRPTPEPGAHRLGHGTPPAGVPVNRPGPVRDVGRWTDPGALAAQEAQRARNGEVPEGAGITDLSSAQLLRPHRRRTPRNGWRRWVYLLTGGLINPGEGPQELRERELTTRINQPLLGCHKIATLSLKGGVGKTTITATLGATFASLRGDRVVAVDANPDRGTLSQKIPLETSATVRHLLRDSQRVRRYTDVRAYTSQGPSRLEVLASEQDPAVSEAFSEGDYRRTITLLEHFYNIVLTDCGTGLMHSAMYGVLGVADQLIIVSSGSIDGARSASATMDWLEAHEHGELVRNAVAVINNVHRQAGAVDLERVAQHFAGRCRAVIQIPFDPHLEEGAEVDLDQLSPATRAALLELAASVADGFPS